MKVLIIFLFDMLLIVSIDGRDSEYIFSNRNESHKQDQIQTTITENPDGKRTNFIETELCFRCTISRWAAFYEVKFFGAEIS